MINRTKIVIVVVIVVLVFLVFTEMDRRRGTIGTPVTQYYSNTSFLLAPMNVWLGYASTQTPLALYPSVSEIFPETKLLKDNWKIIRDEAFGLYDNGLTTTIENDLFFDAIAPRGTWKKFYLKWYAPIQNTTRELCPKTCALLDQLPNVHLAMFSILEPGARIKVHRGVFRGALRYHLGLITPNDPNCFIVLDNKKYSWRDGEDVLFDDSCVHYVENNTNKTRIILFADIERPLKGKVATKFNQWVCKYLAPLTTRQNDKQEKNEFV
jgi:beta-hydroxylase